MTENGEFRHDLFDRLNVLSLDTIPLREQKGKIREIAVAALERERIAMGRKNSFQIEPLAIALLEDYAWTGNFRELHNFVLKLATEYSDAETITAAHVRELLAEKGVMFQDFETGNEDSPAANVLTLEINADERLDKIIEQVKESYIRHHLQSKSMRRMAKQCGISRYLIQRIADKMEMSRQQL